ncbi:phage holin family protein [Campylobacter hyointestinalis]|uniref:phage holin family protein n=1 Tax=Campylobacter hyointestinalis TaxID=198 RepID=UPI00072483F7|nr:phage holin family protein [Campylobacter hyointestinalis]ANE33753.1 putative membrane protein [Campylobacter hyointestinalis subsp. lawsonii CCUG 27631]CUU87772.1 Uncharacterised protein [Campylobacter hyointestinalis subsp. hyointestinalis]
MDFLDRVGVYVYVIALGFIGGVLSLFSKKKLNECEKRKFCFFGTFLLGVATSIFAGYIGFEIANFIFENEKISLAISCICAWAGTDGLLSLETSAIELLSRKMERK